MSQVASEHGTSRLRLVAGDNLPAMARLATEGVRVELAYLDPPFFTQRLHLRTVRHGRGGEATRSKVTAFDDRWPNFDAYLEVMEARIVAVRELLSDQGAMVLHVDPTSSHYLKVACDRIFGRDAFASEIVWRYRRWPARTRNFQRVHDVLLRYVKNPRLEPRFVQLYEPLAPSTVATWGQAKQLAAFGRDGRRVRSTRTDEASPGVPMGDVWEIGVIAPVARERTGYPTQKPAALLERIVASGTYPGDTVLDPYCGSGTTLAVAATLGRHAIGIDQSPEALRVTRERLAAAGRELVEESLATTG
ncbi:MAG: site-specific DNA-methyltransferase [Deltaproteobacteria bacterium]|nr:site-specific DNA-methyltransferase [Deltaproteobacteria bacterium]